MPGRRPVEHGSFGGHFDELVKHFPENSAVKFGSLKDKQRPKPKVQTPACVNRLLLDEKSR